MPIYEYRCDGCGKVFEEWRRHVDDVAEEACPECRAVAHRLISNTSFVLKGGGWYVTEYGNRKKDDSASGAAKSPAAPGKAASEAAASSSPAEAKPAPEPAAAS